MPVLDGESIVVVKPSGLNPLQVSVLLSRSEISKLHAKTAATLLVHRGLLGYLL